MMEQLRLPNNIKVHFAACEKCLDTPILYQSGVNYGLYTAYPYVARKFFNKAVAPIMPFRWMTEPSVEIPKFIHDNMRHTIQDSGLFSLMFGPAGNNLEPRDLYKWYDLLVEFTLNHGCNVTCVEMDCQKILGPQEAWHFRERMRADLPNNRIINVFHVEDGRYGLDRLIEYSDYISVGAPELRFLGLQHYIPTIVQYIKDRKTDIDIHILGCTNLKILKYCRDCTSCDSTSWVSGKRFGTINGTVIKNISVDKVKEYVGEYQWEKITTHMNDRNSAITYLNLETIKRQNEEVLGCQDYINRDLPISLLI